MGIVTDFLSEKKIRKSLRGVIHIGAGFCEEWAEYRDLGVDKVLWIDGNEKALKIGMEIIKNNNITNQTSIQQYLSHKNGKETFYTTVNRFMPKSVGRDDSLLKPFEIGGVTLVSIIEIDVKRLDKLFSESNINISEYNILVIDVQGAELKVLAGCGDILNQMDYIICETWRDNKEENYENQSTIKSMETFMGLYKFKQIDMIQGHGGIWVDILFKKQEEKIGETI